MDKSKRLLLFRIISVILLLSVAVTIFCLSAKPAKKSAGQSGRVTRIICSIFYPGFNKMNEQEQAEIIKKYHTPVRKAAHITLFFLLGATAFLSIISYTGLRLPFRVGISFVFSVLYAASDEYHQSFVGGRGPQVRDVLIDCIGITAATVILFFVFKSVKIRNFIGMEERMNAK